MDDEYAAYVIARICSILVEDLTYLSRQSKGKIVFSSVAVWKGGWILFLIRKFQDKKSCDLPPRVKKGEGYNQQTHRIGKYEREAHVISSCLCSVYGAYKKSKKIEFFMPSYHKERRRIMVKLSFSCFDMVLCGTCIQFLNVWTEVMV